ncbi:S8 family serine peptidase [candidate division KSB1 bacterium]|nr:S8 family serine peptidase [candidate division KSB1 bacterium]
MTVINVSAQPHRAPANHDKLVKIATHYAKKGQKWKTESIQFTQVRKMPVFGQSKHGKIFEIQRIIHGLPFYYLTQNLIAAQTISTDRVWPGMPDGFHLDGQDFTVCLWDAGKVFAQHQELVGRVVQGDNPSYISTHSTSVAGTLIAEGIVESAKGMAPAAMLRAFDWNQDFAEMADEAASGMLVSNHSYSILVGWAGGNFGQGEGWYWFGDVDISEYKSYVFGHYTDLARQIDSIAIAAPYYLSVWASGNDRNEGPSEAVSHWAWSSILGGWIFSDIYRNKDGPYDCISGPGLAKNVLTVGSVNDILSGYENPQDVIMSSNSSWGPADDGRIKPDVVANGTYLLTTGAGSVQSYVRGSGTSFAAPTIAGSLLLLQQQYYNLHSAYLKAAALKALVVHTADEAGSSTGPDYVYGWGLMNTLNAARLISKDDSSNIFIHEKNFLGTPETLYLYAQGKIPVKATLAWTDPPGHPEQPQLDSRTPMLKNDLDLRIIRTADAVIFEPYLLDPENPTHFAITGDNRVDNVEMIFINTPLSGVYTVTVDCKNTPDSESQEYSLILTGLEPASNAIVEIKTFLQGAAAQSLGMRTDLLEWVPENSPYPEAPSSGTIGQDIVDWVVLEFVCCEDSLLYPTACLLRNDGYLVDPQGLSTPIPINIPIGYYYINIRHRNHVVIQSADSVLIDQDAVFYDFTGGIDRYYCTGAAVELSNGIWCARTGDGNQSGGVYAQDYVLVRQFWQQSGYLTADYNMDGIVDDLDLNMYYNNQGHEAR